MKLLNMDLDFFLDNIAHNRNGLGTERLEDNYCNHWTDIEVRTFLEERCGLSRSSPVKGKYFIHHHEVFGYWRELIDQGQLQTPFEVVHVDAHSDLGVGDYSYNYIMTKLLWMPVNERAYPMEDAFCGLGPGNYLAFAVACQWIGELAFISHPRRDPGFPGLHLENFDIESRHIQLKRYRAGQPDDLICRRDLRSGPQPVALEPKVPFHITRVDDFYTNEPFSFVSLAQSPSFTPAAADKLIPIIREYIDES